MNIKITLMLLGAMFVATANSHAAVVAIDSIGLSNAVSDPAREDADITSFNIAGQNYLVSGTAVGADGTGSDHVFATDGTNPGSQSASIIGATVTDGTLNPSDGEEVDFGRAIGAAEQIFIIELEGDRGDASNNDTISVVLNDAGGNAISDALSIVAADWGTGGVLDVDFERDNGGDFGGRLFGVAFQLSDFTNVSGTAFGLEIRDTGVNTGFNQLDPTVFGLATPSIPEPTTALLGMLGMAGLARRRRTA